MIKKTDSGLIMKRKCRDWKVGHLQSTNLRASISKRINLWVLKRQQEEEL